MIVSDRSDSAWQTVDHGQLYWQPAFYSPTQADQLYQQLLDELDWQQRPITMFGRQILQPRLQAWCGDATYRYSGLTMTPDPWSPALLTIRQHIEQALVDIPGVRFNSVLANLYRDGADYMGWHQDNEPELGAEPVIASLSLGETRRFVLRHIESKEKREYPLSHGSLLVMAGQLQTHWQHSVPKTRQLKMPRINLTFRLMS
ncbi:alpha-ketoglutarate-dependent dioxygenase AlkB [Photobacterium japonica]|uniref:alpha-ketoglutarate-dependent dioxygenase AlkB family protein n=1 Tax=Photobacterium japonica TaxID=2910235 RepID=UPI003D13FA15